MKWSKTHPPSFINRREATDSDVLAINYFEKKEMVSKSLLSPDVARAGVCVCARKRTHTHSARCVVPVVDSGKMKCGGQGPGAGAGKAWDVTEPVQESTFSQRPAVPAFHRLVPGQATWSAPGNGCKATSAAQAWPSGSKVRVAACTQRVSREPSGSPVAR